MELTPVAIHAGSLLSQRLFGPEDADWDMLKMDYTNVATAVFSPVEYGAVGYSEEKAIEKFGEQNIDVYHIHFKPLEWSLAALSNAELMDSPKCMMKQICYQNKVIGFHVVAPHAGEITQAVAIAIKAGASKELFDQTIGIHPTIAEEMTTMSISKRSGITAERKGC